MQHQAFGKNAFLFAAQCRFGLLRSEFTREMCLTEDGGDTIPDLHARDAGSCGDNLSSAVRQWNSWLNTVDPFEYLDVTSIERRRVHVDRYLSGLWAWFRVLNQI